MVVWSLVADEIVTRMGKTNKCAVEKRRPEFLLNAEDVTRYPSALPQNKNTGSSRPQLCPVFLLLELQPTVILRIDDDWLIIYWILVPRSEPNSKTIMQVGPQLTAGIGVHFSIISQVPGALAFFFNDLAHSQR